jgi:hypothetical protein
LSAVWKRGNRPCQQWCASGFADIKTTVFFDEGSKGGNALSYSGHFAVGIVVGIYSAPSILNGETTAVVITVFSVLAGLLLGVKMPPSIKTTLPLALGVLLGVWL